MLLKALTTECTELTDYTEKKLASSGVPAVSLEADLKGKFELNHY